MNPRDSRSCAYTVTIISSERKRSAKSAFHFTPSRLAGVLAGCNVIAQVYEPPRASALSF